MRTRDIYRVYVPDGAGGERVALEGETVEHVASQIALFAKERRAAFREIRHERETIRTATEVVGRLPVPDIR